MSEFKALKKKVVMFYESDLEVLEYARTLLNFSEWVKEKLRQNMVQIKNSHSKMREIHHIEKIIQKTVVFTERDVEILNFAEQLNFTKWVKSELLNELNEKRLKGDAVFKQCIICGKINLRRKVTCSDECEILHKKQLQAHADKLRNARDREKRLAYQREYYKKRKLKK
ncbi:hypothetical protein [Acinetobacter sp.]|uniref:hypothetical protein n=1 Tax=Acinetobacter sp. TaxID=472 RepID=UPI002587A78D|nr:hypothetical protein [Acinetobacter sp.]